MKPTKIAGLGAERKQIREKPQPKPLSREVCKLVPETRAAGWPLSPYGRYARDSALTQDKGLLLQEASGITCMFHTHNHGSQCAATRGDTSSSRCQPAGLGSGCLSSHTTKNLPGWEARKPLSRCLPKLGPSPMKPTSPRDTKWDTGGVCEHSQGTRGNRHIFPWRAYGLH